MAGYERVGNERRGENTRGIEGNANRDITDKGMAQNMKGSSEAAPRMGFMKTSRSGRMGDERNAELLEEVYSIISERMCLALCFHEQLADYFCFLGLQGFKRMCEYQYMKECAGKRKLHKRYIDMHHRIIPVDMDVYAGEKPDIIPKDWSRYTTHDIDDSVVPKFVRMALKDYYEWETETKDVYSEQCERLMQVNAYADYEFLKAMILDVEKEIKKVMHLYERLNATGYDVNAINGLQDKYHEKYKRKYDERFTKKHVATGRTVNADNPSRAVKHM